MKSKGVIAAGHEETARAGQIILQEGGNAFDAVLAAFCAACVSEPVLASLGGGGFLLAHPAGAGGKPCLYDFFVQTPRRRDLGSEVDFFPIVADFGEAQQEFHIGLGSMATPGAVRGLFGAHGDLGSMPMARIVEPALQLAKRGVVINDFQEYLFSVVEKIYVSNETSLKAYGSSRDPGTLAAAGEILTFADFADCLDSLAREGEDLFYRGEIAASLAADCRQGGGYLRRDDLESYRLHRRPPLAVDYRDTRILTNPPPSTGGILIAFALALLRDSGLGGEGFGSPGHLQRLASVMALTNEARVESGLHLNRDDSGGILDPGFLEAYRTRVFGHPKARRGTTHVSVIDGAGNAAALTVSNGEGAAYIVPGTGIMINNMLGEEDINPHGFNQWPEDSRMSSMMAPSLIESPDGSVTALGSGGSNRIRTAILQVMVNLIDHAMPLAEAIESPRMHVERGLLSLESGFAEAHVVPLAGLAEEVRVWGGKNMFFGGVHAVRRRPSRGDLQGAGDSRRGGVVLEA